LFLRKKNSQLAAANLNHSQAYVVSFKLETDPALVIPKARLALATYGHQLVVANLLQTRATTVTLVDPQVGWLLFSPILSLTFTFMCRPHWTWCLVLMAGGTWKQPLLQKFSGGTRRRLRLRQF
jgi:hypothetical protein